MSEIPTSLAAALVAFQANLPAIAKSLTAEVTTKSGGKYRYSYADLASVSAMVLPRLGAVGLSFTTKPTMRDGKFCLVYKLLHASGEFDEGEYPLPQEGTPQEFGSAITYARRYSLLSVTGVAPEDDDDGAAASSTRTHVGRGPRDEERVERRPQPDPTPAQVGRYDELAKMLAAATSEGALLIGWDMTKDAYKAGEITTVQANELKAEIGRLRQQLPPADEPSGEAPPEPPESAPLTDTTRKRVFALFRAVGMTDDLDQHIYASSTLNRAVESFTTLTEDEGQRLAKALDGRKRALARSSS